MKATPWRFWQAISFSHGRRPSRQAFLFVPPMPNKWPRVVARLRPATRVSRIPGKRAQSSSLVPAAKHELSPTALIGRPRAGGTLSKWSPRTRYQQYSVHSMDDARPIRYCIPTLGEKSPIVVPRTRTSACSGGVDLEAILFLGTWAECPVAKQLSWPGCSIGDFCLGK
jgi:hypothetical protein